MIKNVLKEPRTRKFKQKWGIKQGKTTQNERKQPRTSQTEPKVDLRSPPKWAKITPKKN